MKAEESANIHSWQKVAGLLEAVRALGPSERGPFLDEACGTDSALRTEVESLLAYEAKADKFLEPSDTPDFELSFSREQADRLIGERIGRFEIIGVLGYGGMGVVYRAKQDRTEREVAVKVVRGTSRFDSRNLTLFEREIRSLARLRHPAIAAIHEAGNTTGGRHYFAMELVDGVSLDRYIKDKKPSYGERLELFKSICNAINYAHQRGVIHRDIKPSNVLVNQEGRPKILDFGLAKITDSDITVTSMRTEVGKIQGTLAYMSPEQARGRSEDIDLRSDVYSLGVLLYEILTECMPYDVKDVSLPEIVRIICDEVPTKLSTAIRALRGDLETIVAQAMEKDPSRRYQSAGALTEDIQRYQLHHPILARPPSTSYMLRKLIVRHKTPFVLVTCMFLLLGIFGVWMSVLYQRADAEAAKARIEARKAEKISGFLTNMITSIQPSRAKGKEVTVRELVDQASDRIATDLGDEPLVRAEIEGTLTQTYELLGSYEDAIKHADAHAAILREHLGSDHIDTLVAELRASEEYARAGRSTEAMNRQLEVLSKVRNLPGHFRAIKAEALARVGNSLSNDGRLAEARPFFEEAVSIVQNELGASSLLGMINGYYGRHCILEGRNTDAVRLLTESVGLHEQVIGPDHPYTIHRKNELALALLRQGDPYEAVQWAEIVAITARNVLDSRHRFTVRAYDQLCLVLERLARFDEAEAKALEILELHRSSLDQPDLTIARDYQRLLRIAHSSGDAARIEECASAFTSLLHNIGDRSSDDSSALNPVAWWLLTVEPDSHRDSETALRYATRAVELTQRQDAAMLDTLARAQVAGGDLESALATQREALNLMSLRASSKRNELENSLEWIHIQGNREGMEAYRRTLVRDRTSEFGETHPDTINAWGNLAGFLSRHDKHEESADIHKRLLDLVEEEHGERCFDSTAHYGGYGLSLLKLGRPQEAEAPLRESVALFKKYGGEKSDQAVVFSSHYGDCLTHLGKFDEAQVHLLNAQRSMEARWGPRHKHTANNTNRLLELYKEWGKIEESEVWMNRVQDHEQPN